MMRCRVLHIVDSLDARTGGPAYSVPNLVNALRSAGVDADVLTGCATGGEVELLSSVIVHEQVACGLSGKFIWYSRLKKEISNYDLVHLHGCWDVKLLLAAKAAKKYGKPYVVSPRGMLEPWSLAQGKLKKRLAWQFYQRWILNKAACVHATAKMEADNLRSLPGMIAPVEVVANGVEIPEQIDKITARHNTVQRYPKLDGRRIMLFLSRLHYKKGLDRLLDFWRANAGLVNDWVLVIAGEGQDDYVNTLRQAASNDIDAGRVAFIGGVYGQAKSDLLAAADVFVLPTASENFGIAIAEALAAETTVITTTGTPWQEITENQCGWWVDLAGDELEVILAEVMNMPSDVLIEMGKRGRELIRSGYTWSILGEQMRQVYGRFCLKSV